MRYIATALMLSEQVLAELATSGPLGLDAKEISERLGVDEGGVAEALGRLRVAGKIDLADGAREPTAATPNRIRVVSAAIISRAPGRAPRVLLGQRAPSMDCPFAWCTPGGKVDLGEGDEVALQRELREELNISVSRATMRDRGRFDVDPPRTRSPISLRLYAIDVGSGDMLWDLRLSDEIIGVGWFTAEDLTRITLAPADEEARSVLGQLLAPS